MPLPTVSRRCPRPSWALCPRSLLQLTTVLTSHVTGHDLVHQHLREHGFERVVLCPEQRFGQQHDGIVELSVVEDFVIRATRFFESGVEDLYAMPIRNHVPFNGQQKELSYVHQ